MRKTRLSEPSTWGSIGATLMGFAAAPSNVLPGIDAALPWQIRTGAFVLGVACCAVGVFMREWPNK